MPLLAVAASLFVAVFVLRVLVEDAAHPVAVLFAVPIALLAAERGVAWGLASAAFALGLFGFWDMTWASGSDHSVWQYMTRAVVFFVVGGFVGALGDRLRSVTAQSNRFWEVSTQMLATAGFDGYFKRLNPAWERTLGWTTDELRSRPFIDFVHPDDRARTEAEAARLTGAGYETINFENRYRCKDGSYRILLWGSSSIPDEELIFATATDVTERKRAEQVAETARAEAERANQAKSEFLSRMSHELRTPLNAVIGFGQLLELDDLDPDQREGVQQILKGGRHLLELINEVLDISRIESGTLSISMEPVHLGSVLADALSLIRPLADEAEVALIADPSEHSDVHVLADQQRLKQVLINLLSNAVKYNRRGGEVRVHCTALGERRIEVAVADTGSGMTADQLERLFDPFDRLGADTTGIEGTGLGLSLSRGLVEAMGGTIKAESQPQTGTTIRVELDTAQETEIQIAAGNGAPALGDGASPVRRTIVYIEDNLSNLKLVERSLDHVPGLRLIPAMQGTLGIDLARQHRPDLILLDLHLPDLHGREVLQELKSDPATAAIPVVVVSADATPTQVERLRAAGAADYLTKPIDVESLLNTVTGDLSGSATR